MQNEEVKLLPVLCGTSRSFATVRAMQDRRRVQISVPLPAELREFVERCAVHEDRTLAQPRSLRRRDRLAAAVGGLRGRPRA